AREHRRRKELHSSHRGERRRGPFDPLLARTQIGDRRREHVVTRDPRQGLLANDQRWEFLDQGLRRTDHPRRQLRLLFVQGGSLFGRLHLHLTQYRQWRLLELGEGWFALQLVHGRALRRREPLGASRRRRHVLRLSRRQRHHLEALRRRHAE